MAETQTPPAAEKNDKPKKVSRKVTLDQMYMIGAKRFGPGEVVVDNDKDADILEAAVERNADKLPMGDDEAHERPDGSLSILHPETRIDDSVIRRQQLGDAIMETGAPEKEEEDNMQRTEDAKKSRQKVLQNRKAKKTGKASPKQEETKKPEAKK